MKVKSILVSQPKPQAENSPYYEIEKRNKINAIQPIFIFSM